MKILDFFYLSFRNLQRRKLRSWLTIIGIIIGISSVIALVSISQGMQEAIEESFSELGKDKLMIFPGSSGSTPASLFMGKGFSEDEVKRLESISEIKEIFPFIMDSRIFYTKKKIIPATVFGIPIEKSKEFGDMGFKLYKGKNIKHNGECLIGHMLWKDYDLSIGDKLITESYKCKVVGILESVGSRFEDYGVYISLDDAKTLLGKDTYDVILIKVKGDAEELSDKIKDKIEKKWNRKDFSLLTTGQIVKQAKSILGIISLVVIAIALISLVVSGIGIMNTMYMSVTERIKEIGILKAIGAKNSEILLIFLIESGLLGMIGGIIGSVLGLSFALVVEYFAKEFGYTLFKASLHPLIFLFSIIFAFLVGIISGLAPAMHASKLDPVKALRHE